MRETRHILQLASAAALTLALGQGAHAESVVSQAPASDAPASEAPTLAVPALEAPAVDAPGMEAPTAEALAPEAARPETSAPEPPVTEAPAAEAPGTGAPAQPASPPASLAAARERMEARQAEHMQERRLRYDELRARAAEVGLDLPEIPPWEQAGLQPLAMPAPPQMPSAPDMPQPPAMTAPTGAMAPGAGPTGMSREDREAHREMMRSMTPEERRAMHEAHRQQMREQAELRRQERDERWAKYRSVVEAMSEEQREAAAAVFGQAASQLPQLSMPPRMPMQAPYGGDYGMPMAPSMPGYSGQGAGPSMYDWGGGNPWSGGNQGMYQMPLPSTQGYGQPW